MNSNKIVLLCWIALFTGLNIILFDNTFAGRILESEYPKFSWHFEEVIIRDFFNDKREGIFVDVGCAHWRGGSNTLYLEKYLDWSGIGVDALDIYAEGYKKYRPKTKFFNYIVTDHSGTIEPFYYSLVDPGGSSLYEEYAVKKIADRYKTNPEYKIIYVPTITLNELLEKSNITKIDLLSIDVEGSELLVLAGFDIERFKPELVCIEVLNNKKDKILEYFLKHNYERIDKYLKYDKFNWYFRPKSK